MKHSWKSLGVNEFGRHRHVTPGAEKLAATPTSTPLHSSQGPAVNCSAQSLDFKLKPENWVTDWEFWSTENSWPDCVLRERGQHLWDSEQTGSIRIFMTGILTSAPSPKNKSCRVKWTWRKFSKESKGSSHSPAALVTPGFVTLQDQSRMKATIPWKCCSDLSVIGISIESPVGSRESGKSQEKGKQNVV